MPGSHPTEGPWVVGAGDYAVVLVVVVVPGAVVLAVPVSGDTVVGTVPPEDDGADSETPVELGETLPGPVPVPVLTGLGELELGEPELGELELGEPVTTGLVGAGLCEALVEPVEMVLNELVGDTLAEGLPGSAPVETDGLEVGE